MALTICPSIMSLLSVIVMGFSFSAQASTFYAGGEDGWTLEASENYTRWAESYRFQVNDEIVFKYKKGHDSVLVVSENDYYKCNKDSPIEILKGGDSKFKFTNSGPFYFISGHNQNCEKGQKLVVVVISNRHHHTHNAASPPPETPHEPPSAGSSPSPATKPVPPVKQPSHFPSPNSPHSPTPSPAPKNTPPSHSPSPYVDKEAPAPSPLSHHSPSSHPEADSPKDNKGEPKIDGHAPPPHAYPPHHAPAPAPSAASDLGVGIVGFGIVAASIISAGFI